MTKDADDLRSAAVQAREALRPFANYACQPPCNCHNCRAREVIAALDSALAAAPAPQPKATGTIAHVGSGSATLIGAVWHMLAASPQQDGPSDAEMLDWLESKCTGASDSERYLPFRVYWGKKGHGKTLREAIRAAMRGDTGGKANG